MKEFLPHRFTDATPDGVCCAVMAVRVGAAEDLRHHVRAGFRPQAQWVSPAAHLGQRELRGRN